MGRFIYDTNANSVDIEDRTLAHLRIVIMNKLRRSEPFMFDIEIGDVVMGAKLYADGYTGRARMVVDLDRGHLLGVTMVGPGVTELLHSATIAVAGQVPVDRLWHAVPCFPTISELWLRLLEAYRDVSEDN